jgi:HK97 family phage portal protein
VGVKTFLGNVRDFARTKLFNSEQRSSAFYSSYSSIESFLSLLKDSLGFHSDDDQGYNITAKTAMRIATFFTCVLVRAESLASLPAGVKQYTSKGTVTAYSQPAHYLIHDRPNPFQTASDFWKQVSAHIDIHGEAIGVISWSGRWHPVAINLVEDPCMVDVKIYDGRPWYDFKGQSNIIESRLYADWEVLHFKDLSLDGIRGCSKVRYNAETLGYASKLKQFGKNAIGSKPNGYFSSDAPFETIKNQQVDLGKNWKENIAKGLVPFLPLGLKYHYLAISPGDAQYLDAIAATKEDIYGITRVPPTLAQNYERATFANAEQQDLVFIKYTMLPLITNIEQECNSKLFSESNKTSKEPYYVKFNVAAFMRGDFKSRAEGYRTLFNIGAIDGDTIADLEDWNKWEGGDKRYVPMNMIPIDMVEGFIKSISAGKIPPAKTKNSNSKRNNDIMQGILFNQKKNGVPVNGHG